MKARIKNSEESIVISIDGKIDYESQDKVCELLSNTLEKSKRDHTPKRIIVDFQNLEFVGSTGITQFVQNLKAIHNETDITPKYCGVRSEFQKIIRAFDEQNEFDFYDDEGLSKRNGKAILNQ